MFQENITIVKESFKQFKGTGMYLALFFFSIIYIFLKNIIFLLTFKCVLGILSI